MNLTNYWSEFEEMMVCFDKMYHKLWDQATKNSKNDIPAFDNDVNAEKNYLLIHLYD